MMLIGLDQGCVFDLNNQEYSLFIDIGSESIGYHAQRVEGDTFIMRRSRRINGVAVSAIDRQVEVADMETLVEIFDMPEGEAEAYVWFVRGFKGVPIRLQKRTAPPVLVDEEGMSYAVGSISGI